MRVLGDRPVNSPMLVSDHRTPDHPVDPIFVHRYSPRAMSGATISTAQLMTLLEAARWAPSSYNEQPWCFVYARRETPAFARFLGLLVEANQAWAHRAGVLLLVASRTSFARNDKPNAVHAFDAGAAWQNLALQGTQMGLVVHAMAGFDRARARAELRVPKEYEPQAMIAVGRPGKIEDLPEPMRPGEIPSGRRPIAQWAFEGGFPA